MKGFVSVGIIFFHGKCAKLNKNAKEIQKDENKTKQI